MGAWKSVSRSCFITIIPELLFSFFMYELPAPEREKWEENMSGPRCASRGHSSAPPPNAEPMTVASVLQAVVAHLASPYQRVRR